MTRRGFTIVELLVVIAIVGLLCACLAGGVQAARESARRGQCASNLRQFGVALQVYHSSFRCFPLGNTRGFSFHTAILSQMEQGAVERMLDRSKSASSGVNLAVSAAVCPATFRCPSDSASAYRGGLRGTNYAANFGAGYQKYGYNGVFRSADGGAIRGVAAGEITDGLSRTAAVGELLIGIGASADLRRVVLSTVLLAAPSQLDAFAAACQSLTPVTSAMPAEDWQRGRPWIFGDQSETGYNHLLTPNNNNCYNGTRVQEGAYSASSMHPGGVQLLYADGHIEFTSAGVDQAAWRSVGTRNGGDAQ